MPDQPKEETMTNKAKPAQDQEVPATEGTPKLIQLTRNVGGYLYGNTFRVTDAQALALGFEPGDYRVLAEDARG